LHGYHVGGLFGGRGRVIADQRGRKRRRIVRGGGGKREKEKGKKRSAIKLRITYALR